MSQTCELQSRTVKQLKRSVWNVSKLYCSNCFLQVTCQLYLFFQILLKWFWSLIKSNTKQLKRSHFSVIANLWSLAHQVINFYFFLKGQLCAYPYTFSSFPPLRDQFKPYMLLEQENYIFFKCQFNIFHTP